MNLVFDPWIPVVDLNGRTVLISLRQVFDDPEQWQDLALRPHERVAMMRLLIAVAHAALDGPKDRTQRQSLRQDLHSTEPQYLEKWQGRFHLFDKEFPFLQMPGLESTSAGEATLMTKVDPELATGNSPTLFDNAAAGAARTFEPARLAVMLLTFQCFSPGGRIGVAKWGKDLTPGKGSSGHAPALPQNMLHTFLRGKDLLETIILNLLDRNLVEDELNCDWGRPVWEAPPGSFRNKEAITNATRTWLGRLVPLSRAILLNPNGSDLVLANGLDYAGFHVREPSASEKPPSPGKNKQSADPELVSASLGKAIWRELHSVTRLSNRQNAGSGPFALGNLDAEHAQSFDIWTGALVADKAKLEDTVEAVFTVPAAMLNEQACQTYQHGVELAEAVARLVAEAVISFHCAMGMEHLRKAVGRDQAMKIRNQAQFHFWTAMEQDADQLLEIVDEPSALGDKWFPLVRSRGWATLSANCRRETPRQLAAYAKASRKFSLEIAKLRPDNPNEPETSATATAQKA